MNKETMNTEDAVLQHMDALVAVIALTKSLQGACHPAISHILESWIIAMAELIKQFDLVEAYDAAYERAAKTWAKPSMAQEAK